MSHMHIAAISAFLTSTSLGALSADEASTLPLIDAHGIVVAAKVPASEDEELHFDVTFSSDARELLLAVQSETEESSELYRLMATEDERKATAAIGQCWRWYDHIFSGTEFPEADLNIPELTTTQTPSLGGIYSIDNFHGECEDGFWLNYVPKTESRWWWFDAGREFKGKYAKISVRLRYTYDNDDTYGEIRVNDEVVFRGAPGPETLEGEFARRAARSRLLETVGQDSFQLALKRLMLLIGEDEFVRIASSLAVHPDRLTFRYSLRPGPSASTRSVKAISIAESSQRRSGRTIEIGVAAEASTTATILAVPGALVGQIVDKRGVAGTLTTTAIEDDVKSRTTEIAYGELLRRFDDERSAYLYLCVLWNATSCLRNSTPDDVKEQLMRDVLAEAELRAMP